MQELKITRPFDPPINHSFVSLDLDLDLDLEFGLGIETLTTGSKRDFPMGYLSLETRDETISVTKMMDPERRSRNESRAEAMTVRDPEVMAAYNLIRNSKTLTLALP